MTSESLQGGQDGAECTVPDSSGECRSAGLKAGQSAGQRTGPSDQALVMLPWQGLLVAVLAGLCVWGVLEFIMPLYVLPERLEKLDSNNVPQALREESLATAALNRAKNATVSIVLLAFSLAVALSAAEMSLRGNPRRALWGGSLAGLVAALIAVGAGMAGATLIGSLELSEHALAKTMIVQSAVMGGTGLGVGLGMALPLFRPRLLVHCATGCLLGGLLAALVFPIAASVLLPDVNTDNQMPDAGIGRLLWVGLPAGLIGLAVTGLGKQKAKRQ